MQPSATTGGRATFHKDEGRRNPSELCQPVLGLYNEIGGGNEKIVASTFKMGLPEDSELRESLTKRPPEDMRQLMRRIEEYKRLEDDWLQNMGKAPLLGRSW